MTNAEGIEAKSQAPVTFTDAKGERWSFDPACTICHGHGSYIAGYSGREDDGNAPIWEDCDCFIPADGDGMKGGS